jgi:hypothetical protein
VDRLPRDADNFFRVGVDHQGVVQQETLSAAVAGRPHPFDLPEPAKVDFGRVADHEGASLRGLPGQFPMRASNGLERRLVAIKQSIGGFQVPPAFDLARETCRRIVGDFFGYLDQTFRPPLVSEFTTTKIQLSPFCRGLHQATSVKSTPATPA